MRVREATTGDEAAIGTLAGLGDDLDQFASQLLRPDVRVRVLSIDGDVVGAAAAWGSEWHPARSWAHVAVDPAHRRRGVGSALLKELQSSTPVKTKVRAGSSSAGFVAAAGWKVIQTSTIYRLMGRPTEGMDTSLVGHPRECVAAAFLAFYARAHTWDPIGDRITADDMLAATVDNATSTLLVGDPRQPDAVACLWEEGEAWEFSGGPCRDGAQDAVATLLDAARSMAGEKPLLVEADSDMSEVLAELHRRHAEPVDVAHIVASA